MCDTMVAVGSSTSDGSVIFAKNSDREPGEAQVVEHLPARKHARPSSLKCTFIEIPQAGETFETVISRPFWMWGAEMGANEFGLAIGNEAVFTRLPVRDTGLTGMDLLRLAVERTATAIDALKLITSLIGEVGQGGRCGYRNRKFRYHNSFIIADPDEAWVLETADRYWVAEKVLGVRTISNVLTIGRDFDLIGEGTYEFARSSGWCRSSADFDFAQAFGDPILRFSSGGDIRRACTSAALSGAAGELSLSHFFDALRSHNGLDPAEGWRMKMPCAHAGWQITRQSGQTTGSMVSRLSRDSAKHWLTGTSSPCLSVFKPVLLREGPIGTGPTPTASSDPESIFWRHERLHRFVIGDYPGRHPLVEPARAALEQKILASQDFLSPDLCSLLWEEHRQQIPLWIQQASSGLKSTPSGGLMGRYWTRQNSLDHL